MVKSNKKAVFSLFVVFAALAALLVLAGPAGASDGLVSHWPAEGDALDAHGSNDGTLVGATFAAGQVGQGFLLDRVDDYVRVPHSADLEPGTGPFTIKAWVKTSTNDGSAQYIFSKWDFDGNGSFYGARIRNSRLEVFLRYADPSLDDQYFFGFGNLNMADGIFHHIAFVRDTDALEGRLYIDGEIDLQAKTQLIPGPGLGALPCDPTGCALDSLGSLADSTSIGVLNPIVIGASENTIVGFAEFFDGVIDELEHFNVALSSAEIQAQYQAGLGGVVPVHDVGVAGGGFRTKGRVDLSRCGDPCLVDVHIKVKNFSNHEESINYEVTAYGAATAQDDCSGTLDAVPASGSRTAKAVDANGDPLCQIEYTGVGMVDLTLTVSHPPPGADGDPTNNIKTKTVKVVP